MRKYKDIKNEIIMAVGEGMKNGITISDEEYKEILLIIKNKPTVPDGYDYRLRTDLTWEMYELPQQVEDDSTGYTEDELLAMSRSLPYIGQQQQQINKTQFG